MLHSPCMARSQGGVAYIGHLNQSAGNMNFRACAAEDASGAGSQGFQAITESFMQKEMLVL